MTEKKGSLSRQKSVLKFFKSSSRTSASPSLPLDIEDDPGDLPPVQDESDCSLQCHLFSRTHSYVILRKYKCICLGQNSLSGTTAPILILRLWENLSPLMTPVSEPPKTWVSNPRPTKLRYANRDHIYKLCMYYENYTII
jgi:hypothetical protein